MTTALVCILTGQNIPNLLTVHHLRPDKLFLLATSKMKEKGPSLTQALQEGKLEPLPETKTINLREETDLNQLRRQMMKVVVENPDIDQWKVNLTGGTKLMAIAAYEVFREVGAELYYAELGKPLDWKHVESYDPITIDHRLTCNEFLVCCGLETVSPSDEENASEHLYSLAAALAASDQALGFKLGKDPKETKKAWNNLRNGKHPFKPGELTIPPSLIPSFPASLERLGGNLKIEKESLVGKPCKIAGGFLTGGWLEHFFFGLLRNHSEVLGITDVRLGLKISSAQHDLDVSFLRETRFHVVECKTGMEHDDRFEALFKAAAIIAQTKALNVTAHFATTDRTVYDQASKRASDSDDHAEVKKHIVNRAQALNVNLIGPDAIRQLARETDPDNQAQFLENTLFPKKTTS